MHPVRIAAIAAVGLVASVATAFGLGVVRSTGSRPTLAGNRAAAGVDAPRLLHSVQLPPSTTPSTVEPVGDGGFLKPLGELIATTARVDVHGWWKATGAPDAVLAYVKQHPPAGATPSGTGSAGNYRTGQTEQSLMFQWPAIAGVVGERQLDVTVTALPGGDTGILAEAESVWIVPRPAAERVPRGVHEVDVTSAKLGAQLKFSLHVRDPAKVRRLVRLIDSMPIVQPGTYGCPGLQIAGDRQLTLDYRVSMGGSVLAAATYVEYPGLARDSGPCTPIQFTIGTRQENPLIGGSFVGSLQRILRVKLPAVGSHH